MPLIYLITVISYAIYFGKQELLHSRYCSADRLEFHYQ